MNGTDNCELISADRKLEESNFETAFMLSMMPLQFILSVIIRDIFFKSNYQFR